ncbi:hypothetical protein COUCH_25925 [Couchioplanes caeruleus]|uniref:hypothetical protein n=1 Tax=Couchioplanes caeruleus TaxID=56438 RepID=UPI0020BE2227|nr:hypothetical protein [Couchioplanes caeruleus]UQU62460.1 hypothetical protein COUCH_25925 [Couchioplanes caeruleus]
MVKLRIGATVGVLACALQVSLSGCAATATTAGTAAPPARSVSPAPALPVIVAVTPKPRTPAPSVSNTGTAWPAMLASLSGYGQWLLANPDPAKVGTIAAPGCAVYDLISEQADGLLRDKAYVRPAKVTFGTVVGPSPAAGTPVSALGGHVTLDVTVSRPAEAVLSRTGARPITSFPPLATTGLQITLVQGSDGRWRLCTADAQDDTAAADDPSVPFL